MSVRLIFLVVAAVVAAGAVGAGQASPPRVDMNEVLRNIIRKVDPVVPPEAAAAGIGGLVVAEVTITATGVVSTVRIVGGPEPLHRAAADALKQWTFKPFVRSGKPAPVVAILDVSFPDPKRDKAIADNRAFFAALSVCGRELEARSETAVAACETVAKAAESLPQSSSLERADAIGRFGLALALAGRFREALPQLQRSLEIRLVRTGPDDADTGDAYGFVAVVRMQLGELAQADELYAKADQSMTAAMKKLPDYSDGYSRRLASILDQHARLKRRLGQNEVANQIEERARSLRTPEKPAPPKPRPAAMRTVGQAQCHCPDARDVSDAQLALLLKTIPATAKYWLLQVSLGWGGRAPNATVYLTPSRLGVDFRMGEMALTSGSAPDGAERYGLLGSWIQIGTNLGAPLTSPDDSHWPILIGWDLASGPFSAEDTVALIKAALAAVPAPLRIERVMHGGSLDAIAMLSGPGDSGGPGTRQIRMRREGTRWVVVK